MTLTTTLERPRTVAYPPSSVVWIDPNGAIVASMDRHGSIHIVEIDREMDSESAYVARIAHHIGDRQRVVILGPDQARLTLEREYVALFHRPDRLVDVERAGPCGREQLVDRLRTLAQDERT